MKKKAIAIVMALIMVLAASNLVACGDKEITRTDVFSEETVFQLDLTMSTAIGPLVDLCHPGTLTFRKDGTAKMFVKFTPNAKVLMDTILKYTIADFVHEDTYSLSADKKKITYQPTRESFKGEAINMDIELLDDGSMKTVFDIGAVIPQTTLTFYSNQDKMPVLKPEVIEPDEPEVEQIAYDVTFDVGEDVELEQDYVLPEKKVYDKITEITLPEAKFAKKDNVFRGWAANGKTFETGEKYLYQPNEKYSVDTSVNFVAVWSDSLSVTITKGEHAKNSSTAIGDIRMPDTLYGKYVYLPENPYEYKDASKGFAYWTTTGTNKIYPGASLKITEDTVVYPVWNKYVNVTFNADVANGTNYANTLVLPAPIDSRITMPNAAFVCTSDSNKGFAGWLKNSTGNIVKPGTVVTITADTTYTAKFDTLINVSYENGGGVGELPTAFKIGKNLTYLVPECNVKKEGFETYGWLVKTKTTVVQPGALAYSATDIVYTPNFKALRTVSFDLGQGVLGEIKPIISGETLKIKLPEMSSTNGDKLFDYWTNGTGTFKAGSDYTVPAGVDTTLTAVWRDLITVKFSGGAGAIGSVESINQHETKIITLPKSTFTKDGSSFIGWSDGNVNYLAGDIYTIPEGDATEITFNAVWGDGIPFNKDYNATFRAAQTSQFMYKDAKEANVNLNAIMQMSELILRSNSTADLDIRFLTKDADLKKHTDLLGTTVEALREMELVEKNIPYTFDSATNKVTLTLTKGTKLEIILKKVPKSENRPYDSVEFAYPLTTPVGAVEELTFAALDGKPTYVEATRYFRSTEKVSVSIVSGFPELTVNPDGSGKLKVSFLSLDFAHMFNADFSCVIWLGGEGDRIEAKITTNSDGKKVINVSLLGSSLQLVEVDSLA